MPSYRRPYGGSFPRGTNSRPRGGPVVGATGAVSQYIPASQLPGMPSQSPRPVMDYTPVSYQAIPPNGESPQPPDNSLKPIPEWPFANANVNIPPAAYPPVPASAPPMPSGQLPYMVPNTNQPQPLSMAPSPISAPPQSAPPPGTPQIGQANWNNVLVWSGKDWEANPNGPLNSQLPSTPSAPVPPLQNKPSSPDSWMTDPTIGGSMNDPYVIAAQQNQQPTAPPQQAGYFGALGNAAASALSGLAGPQMRQYGNQTSLDPRLTNWRTNV